LQKIQCLRAEVDLGAELLIKAREQAGVWHSEYPAGQDLNGHGNSMSPSPSPGPLLKIGAMISLHLDTIKKKLSEGLIASKDNPRAELL